MAEKKGGVLSKSYVLIPFVLICAGLVAAVLAPVLKPAADAILGKDVKLYRVVERVAALSAVILFIVFRKHLKSQVKVSINPKQNPPGKPFIGGFLIGLATIFAIAAIMAIFGGGHFKKLDVTSTAFWAAFGAALGGALAIAIFEEIFFRGIVFQSLQADLGTGLAAILGGAFFSVVHFMRPSKPLAVSGSDPLGGFKVMFHAFDRFGDFNAILPFAIGLFLIAIALTVAYLKTSALFLPMGLHASVVFFNRLNHSQLTAGKHELLFFQYPGKGSPPLFRCGETDLSFLVGVDAVITWIVLVILTIVVAVVGQKLQSKGGGGASGARQSRESKVRSS